MASIVTLRIPMLKNISDAFSSILALVSISSVFGTAKLENFFGF